MRINSNTAARNTLRFYGQNVERVKESLHNLSSGKSVRDGTDGGAALLLSTTLENNVASLNKAKSNTETAISLLQTAEGALADAAEIVGSMKQIAVHAANEATNDAVLLESDQMEIDRLLDSLRLKSEITTFSGKKLLNGSMGVTGSIVGDGLRFVKAEINTPGSPPEGFKINITQPASRAEMIGSEPLTVDHVAEGFNLVIRESSHVAKLDTGSGNIHEELNKIRDSHLEDPQRFPLEQVNQEIRQLIIHQLNEKIRRQGIPLEAMLTDQGQIKLLHHKYGDHLNFTVMCSIPGIIGQQVGKEEHAILGKDVSGTIGGEPAGGHGRLLTARPGTVAQGAVIEYTANTEMKEAPLMDGNGNRTGKRLEGKTVDELVGSKLEGYLHISQQSKAFQVGGASGDFAEFGLKDIRPSMLAVKVENESGFHSLADIDLTLSGGADDAMDLIDKAYEELNTARVELGSFQKHSLKRSLESVRTESENMSRGISAVSDTNVAEEIADLTKNNILMKSSQGMVAQASQKPRHVLTLIQES